MSATFLNSELHERYRLSQRYVLAGDVVNAREILLGIMEKSMERSILSVMLNDLAVLEALDQKLDRADQALHEALELNPALTVAAANRRIVNGLLQQRAKLELPPAPRSDEQGKCRIAILSFLFNWPSTGGGNIHTVELGRQLGKAGYEVRHLYARYGNWGIGDVRESPLIDSQAIEFLGEEFTIQTIQARFRDAVDQFQPDYVIITDSWNMKPLLADAVSGYPYILRQQALEMLCPLNNLRLLVDGPASVRQCTSNQLSAPHVCHECVGQRQQHSGPLHQMERALAGYGTPQYDQCLQRAVRNAIAVLVHNPTLRECFAPHAENVQIVTWGMDGDRFPWPWKEEPPRLSKGAKTTILMAGVVNELIKGFAVLYAACERLWEQRKDFELIVTGDPTGRAGAFTRFIGWVSQEELPAVMRGADIIAVPTIAQDGLSRTSVEAMGVGRPVIASRIGGLPSTVEHGTTGILCVPGDVDDWTSKLNQLLDQPESRVAMGLAGRRRFETDFLWETVIERHYRPLLCKRRPVSK